MTPDVLAAQLLTIVTPILEARRAGSSADLTVADVVLERPKNRDHGDWASNIAMKLAKSVGTNPRELATAIAEALQAVDGVATVEVAGPGFINVRLDAAAAGALAKTIVDQGTAFGTNQSRADEIVTCLVKVLDGFAVTELQTQTSAGVAMAEWLTTQEPPAGFNIDKECELKATDDTKAVVRYSKHPLDIEEVRQHIATGKAPTKLAMTWDDRVSFVLTDTMLVKKVQFLDVVFEGNKPEDSGFDADAAIATGELTQLIPDLLEALGGEMQLG